MNIFRIISLFFCCSVSAQLLVAQQTKQLKSPDGKLEFSFSLSNDGAPAYSIAYQQNPVILSSTLGLNGWDKGFVLAGISVSKKDTIWKPVYGERSEVRDHYDAMLISLLRNNNEKLKLQIEVRAYNQGIAFRYLFPEHPQGGWM
jgi:alpha-glucosidase